MHADKFQKLFQYKNMVTHANVRYYLSIVLASLVICHVVFGQPFSVFQAEMPYVNKPSVNPACCDGYYEMPFRVKNLFDGEDHEIKLLKDWKPSSGLYNTYTEEYLDQSPMLYLCCYKNTIQELKIPLANLVADAEMASKPLEVTLLIKDKSLHLKTETGKEYCFSGLMSNYYLTSLDMGEDWKNKLHGMDELILEMVCCLNDLVPPELYPPHYQSCTPKNGLF
jgi:hypothetical protein